MSLVAPGLSLKSAARSLIAVIKEATAVVQCNGTDQWRTVSVPAKQVMKKLQATWSPIR